MKQSLHKIFIISIKGFIVLFLLVMLILEAFLTAPYISYDIAVIYTAIITTLCWLLIGLLFIRYSYLQYVFLIIIAMMFFYFYYFDTRLDLAHQQEKCLDLGYVWDAKQNICSYDKIKT